MKLSDLNAVKTAGKLSFVAAVAIFASGCGDDGDDQRGSGASLEPTVGMRPSALTEGTDGSSSGESQTGVGGSDTSSASSSIKEGIGSLKGFVKFSGSAPTMGVTQPNKDQTVCVPYSSERLLVDGNGGVANVFIYLAKAPKNAPEQSDEDAAVMFDQKGCVFAPHAMVVRTGQSIKVLSDDAIAHNTHTKPTRNTEFNSTIPPKDRDGKTVFSYRRAEKEPVRVVCDYHSWMEAWQLPIDHPYAVVSGADGSFEIGNIPSGEYEFQVWHEGCGFLTKNLKVTIQGDETTDVEIDYPSNRYTAGVATGSGTVRLALGR